MNDNEQFKMIFAELSSMKQFIAAGDNRLIDMKNGCEIILIEEHEGSASGGIFMMPRDAGITLSWGHSKYTLKTIHEAQTFLDLMKER